MECEVRLPFLTSFPTSNLAPRHTQLYQALDIPHPTAGGTATVLVIGRVLAIHMRNDVVDPARGTVLPDKLRAIGRLGGVTYARVTGGFALTRPAWKDLTEEEKALARGE